jgi:hypothetical protein
VPTDRSPPTTVLRPPPEHASHRYHWVQDTDDGVVELMIWDQSSETWMFEGVGIKLRPHSTWLDGLRYLLPVLPPEDGANVH